MRPLTLALDIGNVCIRIDFNNCWRALHLTEPLPQLLHAERAYECGKMTTEEFFDAVRHLLPEPFSFQYCLDAFNAILVEPVPGMTELVRSFASRNVRPVFFSDISAVHLEKTRKLFPAADCVPEGIYSFEAGNMKFSSQMQGGFERRFGRPDLYIDDRQELLDAAAAAGWPTFHFTSADDLKKKLDELQGL